MVLLADNLEITDRLILTGFGSRPRFDSRGRKYSNYFNLLKKNPKHKSVKDFSGK